MRLKSLTHFNEVLNFVLEDGSVYVIIRNKEGNFVCTGELYQPEHQDPKLELDNQKCC